MVTVIDSDNNQITIPISGIGHDPTISEFPHFEGFEELLKVKEKSQNELKDYNYRNHSCFNRISN